MTIEEFRAYPNCSDYTDEEAGQLLQSLDLLAIILFEYTCRETGMDIDNQLITTEKGNEQQNFAA